MPEQDVSPKDATVRPMLSLVVPVHNEEGVVDIFYNRIISVLSPVTEDWEILFVDDGSTDTTLACLAVLRAKDVRVKFISFSRNFGKEAALTAGLHHASGRAIIPMDVDLQDPPELIAEMVRQWREGFEVVLAIRQSRNDDTWMKRTTAKYFYKFIQKIAHTRIPENAGDFRLMDRKVVDAVNRLPERTRFMKGLLSWAGFKTTQLYFDRPERAAGTAKQNYRKLWRLALDGIFSFTSAPLQVWTYIGFMISLGALVYGLFIFMKTLLLGVDMPGYASLMTVMLFLGGMQLLSLGIIGEYISRIYGETKHRPLYIIRDAGGVDEIN